MPNYKRWYVPGDTYFFTVVTQDRSPIFREMGAVRLFGDVLRKVRAKHPFRTFAIVVLWDHVHCIWTLPGGDDDFSGRWRWIKGEFTRRWIAAGGAEKTRTPSRVRKGEHGVWQRRFWEHRIRDEDDLERHLDYIHYNPVKHGYVLRPGDWPWSTFGRHVRLGQYPSAWGASEPNEPFPCPGE